MIRDVIAVLCAMAATPALAADRSYSVATFDGLRVDGAFTVAVTSGPGPSVRVTGRQADIDVITVRVEAGTLIIRAPSLARIDRATAGQGMAVTITAPRLRAVALSGSGAVSVDRLQGDVVRIGAGGTGQVAVGQVSAGRLEATLTDGGELDVAGRVDRALVTMIGAPVLRASDLAVGDLTLNAQGDSRAAARATQRARIVAGGPSRVLIAGNPDCQVRSDGPAEVLCGDEALQQAEGGELAE